LHENGSGKDVQVEVPGITNFRNVVSYWWSGCPYNVQCTGVTSVGFKPNMGFENMHGGDFRLTASSPLINIGNNSLINWATDMDDKPRLVGPAVDLGAYERQ
jgi:hypothetical protein